MHSSALRVEVLGVFVSLKPVRGQGQECIEVNVWMSPLASDMDHWLFISRKGLGSYDLEISPNIEHVSLKD